MGKELYVGHMSFDTTEYDLEKLFSVSGRVTSVHLITDSHTGEFKGCGYVRMSTEAEAKDAIASLDGAMLIDRTITVSEARPQKQLLPKGGYKGKSAGARGPAAGKGASAKDDFAKPAGAKPAPAKAGGFKAGGAKQAAAKPESPKSGGFKAAGAKPAAANRAPSKAASAQGTPRTGTSRSGKR